jgi:hypothetical protein
MTLGCEVIAKSSLSSCDASAVASAKSSETLKNFGSEDPFLGTNVIPEFFSS